MQIEYLKISIGHGSVQDNHLSQVIPAHSIFTSQPAQFQPRDDWSHIRDSGAAPRAESSRSDSLFGVQQKEAEFTDTLQILGPAATKPFLNGKKVGEERWQGHCWSLWQFFTRFAQSKMATGSSLIAFLVLVRAGLESQLGIATYPMQLRPNPSPNDPEHNKSYPVGTKLMLSPKYQFFGHEKLDDFRKEAAGRRFYAGLVHFKEEPHFASFVWDWHLRHLYVFDTLPSGRHPRVLAVAKAMNQVLATAVDTSSVGFQVIAPPVSPQAGAWECGYLCSYLVHIHMRHLAGVDHAELQRVFSPISLPFDDQAKPASNLILPVIPARDWRSKAWVEEVETYAEDVNKVRLLAQSMILDSLGISKGAYIDHAKETVRLSTLPGMIRRGLEQEAGGDWLVNDVFTPLGGLQYVDFSNTQLPDIVPYNITRILPVPSSLYELAQPQQWHTREVGGSNQEWAYVTSIKTMPPEQVIDRCVLAQSMQHNSSFRTWLSLVPSQHAISSSNDEQQPDTASRYTGTPSPRPRGVTFCEFTSDLATDLLRAISSQQRGLSSSDIDTKLVELFIADFLQNNRMVACGLVENVVYPDVMKT